MFKSEMCMNKQVGMSGMKWCLALCLSLASVCGQGLMAEGVPAAIKYQAVLRDVEGRPMVSRQDLAVRITLRQGTPNGVILYKETHTDVATDAFGLMQLEIGRGEVAEAGVENLLEVPWENGPIYAQIEVQNDDNGFTLMGTSELLSVPYALYATNSGGGLDLTDRYLPRYDGVRNKLTDSKIMETPMGAIQFNSGNNSYTFPTTRGKTGESLVLKDEQDGTLGWAAGGGGASSCVECNDEQLAYWDRERGILTTTTGVQYASDRKELWISDKVISKGEFFSDSMMEVRKSLVINATVSGNHNLQYDSLPQYHVWVGGYDKKSKIYNLGSGVTIDSSAATPVINFGGGASAWELRTASSSMDYIYTKYDPTQPREVRVGVGLREAMPTPKTRFHVQDGSFLLSSAFGQTDAVSDLDKGYHFYWSGEKGALRMGKFDQDASGLWRSTYLGEGSIALGTNAKALEENNVAIGADAQATGVRSLAIGRNVLAGGTVNSVAIGNNALVSGENAVGIGNGSQSDLNAAAFVAKGAYSVTMGYDVKNEGEGTVVIGRNSLTAAKSSVVVGEDNYVEMNDKKDGTQNVVIGYKNKAWADGTESPKYSILMGDRNDMKMTKSNAIMIGQNGVGVGMDNCVSIGTKLTTQNTGGQTRRCINIGDNNTIATNASTSGAGPVLLGQGLKNFDLDRVVVVGYQNVKPSKSPTIPAVFVVGAVGKNALELYENGEMYVRGVVTQNAPLLASDRRLKTDIEPLNADFSVLKSLSPMRYRLIDDPDQVLQFGFIAQDVERYFPHLVKTDGEGLKSLNYIGLLPVLWQYTQQLEKTVSDQEAEIERLRAETEALKADMKAIKAKLGL